MQKNCKQCQKEFNIEDADLAFYKKISPTFSGKTFEIPVPKLCPDCRRQKRIAWRNVGKFYVRKSDLSGKQIVSCVAPNSKYKIYHNDEWMSDKFDPYEYGQDFDPGRSFFEQLHELSLKVPRPHMNVARNENSEYINNSSDCKNCYLIENSTEAEDSLYSLGLFYSKDCVDCMKVFRSENCYECVNIENCYSCLFCRDAINCSESILLDSCTGCKNCFGCSNLNNKQYWIYNEQKTKEDFEKIRDEFLKVDLGGRKEIIDHTESHFTKYPKKYAHISTSEKASGDYIYHSKNITKSYFIDNCEEVRYCSNLSYAKDFFDVDYWGDRAERSFESAEVGTETSNILFSRKIHGNSRNIYYSVDCCFGCHDLFGCVGVKHGEYSILNKKYSPEEYEKKVAEIITHMQKAGEWGEFFPYYMSQFAYNETSAMDYFPLEKSEAESIGAFWQDKTYDQEASDQSFEPLDISIYSTGQNTEELLSSVLICMVSGRPYKIQPHELVFYIKHNLQIPRVHPDIRYKNRFKQMNRQKTYHRKCMNDDCDNEFETTYAPDRPEKVYCEKCYQQTVL